MTELLGIYFMAFLAGCCFSLCCLDYYRPFLQAAHKYVERKRNEYKHNRETQVPHLFTKFCRIVVATAFDSQLN